MTEKHAVNNSQPQMQTYMHLRLIILSDKAECAGSQVRNIIGKVYDESYMSTIEAVGERTYNNIELIFLKPGTKD